VLKPKPEKWNQSREEVRRLSIESEHRRTRERFLALFEILEVSNATKVALKSGRCSHTVREWVQNYNKLGPDALIYRRTGGHPPL